MIGQATMDIEAAPYGGARYPVDARMDGHTFVKFHLDIGVGDAVMDPLELIQTRDWLGFAGIEPPTVELLSKEQQFAEKLHAYTLPGRTRPNSRVKDLVDIMLLLQRGGLKNQRIKEALNMVFTRRKTHQLPETLNPPPDDWTPVFNKMAEECNINTNIEDAFTALKNAIENLK
ncbi:MAG: nucleotidyl transferase AbiEii/AbiGii toxin family protein [Thermodesulfobacteriota bacterium]|nr:nucleotidyl transferase AbiEii/AbiGii toxin family protein [Thermodesulfobacteriota bacterium]